MEQFYKMDVEIFRECAKVGKKRAEINNIVKLLERFNSKNNQKDL